LTIAEVDALLKRQAILLERQDFHAGLICAVLANVHRTKTSKTFKPRDFMPGGTEKQSPEQMLSVIQNYQNMYEVIDGKDTG
jgi:hypothetical protein